MKRRLSHTLLMTASMAAMFTPVLLRAQPISVDAKIAAYATAPGISGNLSSVGSDSLNNVMTLWAEGFKKVYPNVVVQIEGKGSSTAAPALVSGTAQLGPMSRAMKSEEIDAFEKKYGYKPTEVRVAIDTLAVFVHKDNPVKGMTLKEIDSIFSSTFKRGGLPIDNWSYFKLGGALSSKPISRYGRNSASGTYGFFKEHALSKGDFTVRVKEQPGSSAVVQGIEKEIGGIGYSGIGYATSGVRAIPVANDGKGDKLVEATYANALSGTYPLTRFLYVYINSHPKRGPEPLVAEFIKFVHSQEGQQIVVKDGYYPLTPSMIDRMKGDIGL